MNSVCSESCCNENCKFHFFVYRFLLYDISGGHLHSHAVKASFMEINTDWFGTWRIGREWFVCLTFTFWALVKHPANSDTPNHETLKEKIGTLPDLGVIIQEAFHIKPPIKFSKCRQQDISWIGELNLKYE